MQLEQAALLRTISELPEDDTPRLVYADWLEENGQSPRAEFIRTQIKLSKSDLSIPDRDALKRREAELLREFEDVWRSERPDLPRVHWGHFSRGFIERVIIDDGDALIRAEAMFESGPIRWLDIRRITPQTLGFVIGCPYLKRVRVFSPPITSSEDDLIAIFESPHLAGLEELWLNSANIGTRVVETIATQPHFGRLVNLFLGGNRIDTHGAIAIAESTVLPMMHRLCLFRNPIGDEGAIALANAPHLQQLQQLELQNTRLGDAGVETLARSNVWQNGWQMNLAYNAIRDAGASAIAECPHLANHRVLVLRSNAIGDRGAAALAKSPHLDRIESLEIGSNSLTHRGRKRLRNRFGDRVYG